MDKTSNPPLPDQDKKPAASIRPKATKPAGVVVTPKSQVVPISPTHSAGHVGKVAPAATLKRRHYGTAISFLIVVTLPVFLIALYLFILAADQYASKVGFAIRSEEVSSPLDLLGGLTSLSSGSASDSDILYEFIQSQALVSIIDEKIDLRGLYRKPQGDPVFRLTENASIEDLLDHWNKMVKIYYDNNTQLIELRVLAFTPDDAQKIAEEIVNQSSLMINNLSRAARKDATLYAQEELDRVAARVMSTRKALTQFRALTKIVDPGADIQGQMGVLGNLEQQLATTLIELDLLTGVTNASNPLIAQATRKIGIIEARIAKERDKFGVSGENGREAYAQLVGEYETLTVDREFAEQAYLSSLATYDAAVAEARRKTRYLAAYLEPTRAEKSEYPERFILTGIIALFLALIWGIGVLVYYSIRDRR